MKTAVFLLAHGAPTYVRDIPRYLKNIRGGTNSSPEVIREVAARYEAIGGRSPMIDHTQAQARALEQFLNQGEERFQVYVGMRNWKPYIRDAVNQAMSDGAERLVALCLAPQYSKWSTERYLKSFREALDGWQRKIIEVKFITSWPNQPNLIDAFVERYRAAEADLKAKGKADFHTLFTVHSIPSDSVDMFGDPYVEEYGKTLQGILDQLNLSNWHQAYQSQGMIPVPWLEPSVEEILDKVAKAGGQTALVVPVGFVCDHIEILYDIDIAFKEYAAGKGIELYRTESLNTSPLFTEALAAVVWEHLF
ncbi:MAG: ferrochelatase [Nitrospinaceae bacterium]|nr:ferrochelatase [Nitrospinaceae bacterium]NIR56389.1 ferrochelatase [Nitrospinaceae bacterium]NIS86853.1 ferrochelatase [Nitrospinaceae bacterium]NIT83689.1 ferrochelatase [Nitrospinaceae bacterium]NIU45885.1 ferrochelatase [Nitrospinaceae bacterium]